MGVLFTGLFWGSFLVLLGASFILKALFHIDLPVLRTFLGLFFILLGVQVLLGRGLHRSAGGQTVFGEAESARPEWGRNFDVLFGKAVVDLKTLPKSPDGSLRLNTVFGHSTLRLDPAQPAEVDVSAAFSGARFPDGTVISFGRYVYRNKAWSADKPCVRIHASVVFGAVDVED